MKNWLKNLLKNFGVKLFLIAFPTMLAIACVHILMVVAILTTLLTVEIMFINYRRDYWSWQLIRSWRIYSFFGIAIGLGVLALKTPQQLAIIIALCIFTVGAVQFMLEEPFRVKRMLWLKIYENQSDIEGFAPIEYLLFLAVALLFVLMVVANFCSQAIWLPLTTCGIIVYAIVKVDIFYFSNDLTAKFYSFITLVITGIVSTLIQFNEAKIFGILIWVIALVVGIILVFIITYLYLRAATQEKKRIKIEKVATEEQELKAKKEKDLLQRSLNERISELSWDEIFVGFHKIYESFGIHLFLSSPNLEKLPELVVISNEKKQIFWSNDLLKMFQIMESAARRTQDDEKLKIILDICTSIETYVDSRRTKNASPYKGEFELKSRIEKIRQIVHS